MQFLLTFNWLLFSFWMFSKVYFSERLWRILKRRDPRLEARDSSSSIMSLGTHIFFPRSISVSGHKDMRRGLKRLYPHIQFILVHWSGFWQISFPILSPIWSDWTQIILHREKKPCHKKALYMDCWLGITANMINEELSSLVIHSCLVLVLWLALCSSYCILIMEMSPAKCETYNLPEYLSAVSSLQTLPIPESQTVVLALK